MMGLGEHASVAAFARFVLHLMSLAAPPELIHAAIRAMDDEVEHARLCFGLARRFTGEAKGPGRMDLSRLLVHQDTPESILRAAIVEGCIEETISARCAAVALDRTVDDAIRTALTRIVDDERRHADLAWQFAAWMLETYPYLEPVARSCFVSALAEADETIEDEDDAVLETHGHLGRVMMRSVRETTKREIYARAAELLGSARPSDPLGVTSSTAEARRYAR
jgi:hypothetical protein